MEQSEHSFTFRIFIHVLAPLSMQSLFSPETYLHRRNQLLKNNLSGIGLIIGHGEPPMNYTANTYRFRQDSSFLYLFGLSLPDLVGVLDFDTQKPILFGNDFTLDDIIWVGPQPSLSELAAKVGISDVRPLSQLASFLATQKLIHFTPPYRGETWLKLMEWTQRSKEMLSPSLELIQALVKLRSYKSAEEIERMEVAVNITRQMHLAALSSIQPDRFEYEIVGEVMKQVHGHHAELAYPIIFSTHGQTLHNHHHHLKMASHRLALLDAGAEESFGYAGDITRTFPVSGTFSSQAKQMYQLVLELEESAISLARPGVYYRDVHLATNRRMLQGLKELGLVEGDVNEMLAQGVAGLFMPHGLGHMIGLDVHDMEDYGEQWVGYTPDLTRSTQLGLKSLRLARPLEPGFTLTVEPGIYFIPELIQKWKSEGTDKGFVRYSEVAKWMEIGGIRIEDNILITEQEAHVMGSRIPKSVEEIETWPK